MVRADDQEAAERAALLRRFFTVPNLYVHPGAGATAPAPALAVPQALHDALRRFLSGYGDRPLLLPYRSAGDDRICWYACAHDDTACRALRAELEAFIGPSFAEFDDSGDTAWATPDVVREVLMSAGLRVVRLRCSKPEFDERVPSRWKTYWQLLERQPKRVELEVRSFAQLRSVFDEALVARNEPDALAAVAALRDVHGLSGENRVFLDIRLAAAFGRWEQILAHPRLVELMQLRLPPETYGDIWDALYEVHLRPFENSGSAPHLVQAFVDEVQALAGPLLKGRGRSRRPAALKSLLLDALAQAAPQAALCRELLEAVGPHAFGPATSGIEAMVAALETPSSDFESALDEMDQERYEQAWVLLWPLPDDARVFAALLRCAKEIADPVRGGDVLARLNATSADIAEAVGQTRARLLRDVEQLAREVPPAKLQVQVEAVTEQQAADIVAYWREIAGASSTAILDMRPGLTDELQAALETHALEESPVLDALFPVWFEWLVGKCAPESRLIELYQAFIETLFLRDRFGETELELVRLAALHLVGASPTPTQYQRLLDRLIDVFNVARSPVAARWGLELTDGLLAVPCRSEEALTRWRGVIFDAAEEMRSRLGPVQRSLLRILAAECGYELASPTGSMEVEFPALAIEMVKRVLIYSLDKHATERAAMTLRELFPQGRFETNDDEACTTRLKSSASMADWVVFVSNVATHQAFFCIKAAMRDQTELLQVQGSGTTRIIECVMNKTQQVSAQSSR
ncbi:protein DpdD [Roseateles puraquae]|uniref:Uncharacterized protein n=1 Tax=Roseateles puraquae TaxID=431059 RepID=A0A254N3G7_9BURK|nr:protein DpdD [Roseateles puraquae]MDG0857422.1 hypothetical protein [Roseateles puraquae]OWQ98087.1 hypothetical protein CDO81_26875 [Roseateles puraquae]